MQIFFIMGIPFLLALTAFFVKRQKALGVINSAGYFVVLLASVLLFKKAALSGEDISYFGFIYLDALSAFFILVISIVAFSASLYSMGYMQKKVNLYYVFFNLFCFTMFFVPAMNNLALLWVAIEMTTLVSAFLVGFFNTKESVEAAWKYIIICSMGIVFALLGTILFSYAYSLSGCARGLDWSSMISCSGRMDKNIIKIAFIFILVGYGTKAGLAPMHTWLPDAHSQAVAPISALLSGVLLKTAIYAILRFGMIVIKSVGFSYFGNLLVLFGVVSLAISASFILVQKDLKRLLAYSSIEHIGIISIGFGLGAPLAIAGALLHIFNHAVTKSLMFFGAGNIVNAYEKHNMNSIRGVIKALPFTGIFVLLGVFALTGFPPFSIFFSEIMIIFAAFSSGAYLVTVLLLALLAVVFAAFIYYFGKMLFGNLPKEVQVRGEPLSGKIAFLFLSCLIIAPAAALVWFGKDLVWLAQRLF